MRNALQQIQGTPGHRTRIATAVALALGSTTAGAADASETDPYAMPDGTWINISGIIESVGPDTFSLDYGEGIVVVEMDDGDRDADAYKLLAGDKVAVSGRVDDDFFEATTIEAGSVYVESRGTIFFASSIDEEAAEGFAAAIVSPVDVSKTVVQGTVAVVDDDEFVIDSGIRVDTAELGYNPLDDEGYQKITVGDRVKVVGTMESELFDSHELMADVVVKLN
jgi:hypothetical protein